LIYYHVDVFSSEILSGNGLTVIFHEEDMSMQYMQAIAQEFKQMRLFFSDRPERSVFALESLLWKRNWILPGIRF
jgi:predicted PhzF superfamily epimerase YddE/YHI9